MPFRLLFAVKPEYFEKSIISVRNDYLDKL